jgi:hypothetical protein
MYKRTYGYILFALLVITGLASQVYKPTLDRKERKLLVSQLKDSKADLLTSIKGLSAKQMAFKPAADQWSIQECITHIALTEEALWSMADAALQKPANPEMRSAIKVKDEDLLHMMADRTQKAKAVEALRPEQTKWKTTAEAVEAFKESRQKHIQFAKTTTQDLRNHITEGMMGPVDSYQIMLAVAGHSARHTAQINEIKAHPSFPK